MRRYIATFSLALLAAGCSPNDNHEAGLSCKDTASTIAVADQSPLGFSAQQVLDVLEKSFTETLEWSDGTTTDLTIGVDYTEGAVQYVDSELDESSGTDGAMPLCEDRVEIPVAMQFSTADGAFNETWNVILSAPTAEKATFNVDLNLDALVGTYDYREIDPADYDSVKAYLIGALSDAGATGQLYEQGEKVEGETASASAAEAASWPADTAE